MQIDILEVDGKFYGFSGCHRYEVGVADKQHAGSSSISSSIVHTENTCKSCHDSHAVTPGAETCSAYCGPGM